MDKSKREASAFEFCGLIAQSIDTGVEQSCEELISSVTECEDPEWSIEHIVDINYVLSETMEYSGACLIFQGVGETIRINTAEKIVSYSVGANIVCAYYLKDGLGIDDFCKEKYEETSTTTTTKD